MNIKRITSVIASLASMSCIWSSSVCAKADTKTLTLGDVNGDSLVNAVDASEVLSEYARTSTGGSPLFSDAQKLCGDVDKSGALNAVDASHILSYYAYRSTGGTLMFEEYLTPAPQRQFAYPLEETTQSEEVFNYFADQMNYDIFQGTNVLTKDFDGSEYWDDGFRGAKVALLILNENANYKDGVLREVFNGYTDEDIKRGVRYLASAPSTEGICGGSIDFNNYSLDKDISNYMNQLENVRRNNMISELDTIIEDFFYNNKYDKAYHNMASFYYTVGTGANCLESKYCGTCLGFSDDGNFYGIQEETENRIKELIK